MGALLVRHDSTGDNLLPQWMEEILITNGSGAIRTPKQWKSCCCCWWYKGSFFEPSLSQMQVHRDDNKWLLKIMPFCHYSFSANAMKQLFKSGQGYRHAIRIRPAKGYTVEHLCNEHFYSKMTCIMENWLSHSLYFIYFIYFIYFVYFICIVNALQWRQLQRICLYNEEI